MKLNLFDERREMIKNYENTKEYRDELEKYRNILFEMSKLVSNYIEKPSEIIEKINDTVAYKKYGLGGFYLHRGVMCPSPIQDLVVGNYKRGRLVNKRSSKATYVYSFNQNNQLIKVITLDEFKIEEYIVICDEYTLGLTYDIEGVLIRITQCFYRENIVCYRTGLIMEHRRKVYQLYVEEYQYNDNQLTTADMYNLIGGLSHDRFFFKYDEEGYIHSYTGQELIGLEIVNKEYCDEVYYIGQKRKVIGQKI